MCKYTYQWQWLEFDEKSAIVLRTCVMYTITSVVLILKPYIYCSGVRNIYFPKFIYDILTRIPL